MEPLKNLKLKMPESVKEKHFKQIEARLSVDAPPKPAILPNIISVAVVMLMLFLVILSPSTEVTTETGITKIYVNDMNLPSHSKWYVGVNETTDPHVIEIVEHILTTMKPVGNISGDDEINFRFTVFSANDKHSYGLLLEGDYLLDIESGQYYQFTDQENDSLYSTLWSATNSYSWKIALLFGWLILQIIVDKKFYPRDADGRKLPRHSSVWQTIVHVATIFIVPLVYVLPNLMHYGFIFSIVTLSILVQIWIETKNDNATWRKWLFLDNYWLLICLYVILGN